MKLPPLAILACLAATPVGAQQRGTAQHLQPHAVNPSLSLSAPTNNNPLQEQMREDYASQLMGAQRELLQQNPSGLGRQEQAIGRELNGYTPRWLITPSTRLLRKGSRVRSLDGSAGWNRLPAGVALRHVR
jgi:hypothetical protein